MQWVYTHALHEGRWRLVVVEEGVAGYEVLCDVPPLDSEHAAHAMAVARNRLRKVYAVEEARVIASAHGAQRARDLHEHGL